MPDLLPDADLTKLSNQTKLDDVWWGIRSVSGAGRAILRQSISVLDANWNRSKANTTLEIEIGALPQNFKVLREQVSALTELVKQLSIAQGVTIDYQAIAKAVVDEEAKRLSGKEGA